MKKAESRKLTGGDRVLFGDHGQTQRCGPLRAGTVKHVTPRGGILVSLRTGEQMWVPYHFVVRKLAPGETVSSDFSN